jgi:hypothetical protein
MNSGMLLEEIEEYSNFKLKRKDDLRILIEVCNTNKKTKLFEDLSFTAKYILGLQRVLKKGVINPEINNLEKIKKDYSDNIIKVIEQIKELINLTPGKTKERFDKTYIELSQQGLSNLNELLEDLEWTKMYFNSKKRQ